MEDINVRIDQPTNGSPHPSAGSPTRRRRALCVVAALGLMSLAACESSDGSADGIASVDDVGTAAATDAPGNADDNDKTGDVKAGDDISETSSEVEVDPEIVFAEYEECMEEYGIKIETFSSSSGDGNEVPDNGAVEADGPPQNVSDADYEAADEECLPILDQLNAGFEMSPEVEAATDDYMLEMENCMTDKGFDISMSETGGNTVGDQDSTSTEDSVPDDVDFEELQAAYGECEQEVELPQVLQDLADEAEPANG